MLTGGTIAAIVFISLGSLVTLGAVIFLIAAIRHEDDGYYDDFKDAGFTFGGIGLAVGLLMLVPPMIGLGMVGFNGDYMAYKPVSGQVQDVASRQISDGKSMSTRYVLLIEGQPYGVDDTRAALVKKGDMVSLNCVREFVWGSTNNGYACNWG